jgi:hypothetical protein
MIDDKLILTLALLVLGVFADNANSALAADNLAVFTNFFRAGSDLHNIYVA